MVPPLQLQVPVDRQGLRQAATALRHWLSAKGIGGEAAYGAELALEELGSNLLRHAGPEGAATTLQIAARPDGELLELELIDNGAPFDPTAAALPDLSLPISERPIGGLGLLLVRRLAAHLRYEQLPHGNRLVCRFSRQERAAPPG